MKFFLGQCWNFGSMIKLIKSNHGIILTGICTRLGNRGMHMSKYNQEEGTYTNVERITIDRWKLQFMPTSIFKGWSRINDASVRMTWRPGHTNIGDIYMQFHDQAEKFYISKLINLYYGYEWRQSTQEKVVIQSLSIFILRARIIGSFHGFGKILSISMDGFIV